MIKTTEGAHQVGTYKNKFLQEKYEVRLPIHDTVVVMQMGRPTMSECATCIYMYILEQKMERAASNRTEAKIEHTRDTARSIASAYKTSQRRLGIHSSFLTEAQISMHFLS